jgi:hypothetical protein
LPKKTVEIVVSAIERDTVMPSGEAFDSVGGFDHLPDAFATVARPKACVFLETLDGLGVDRRRTLHRLDEGLGIPWGEDDPPGGLVRSCAFVFDNDVLRNHRGPPFIVLKCSDEDGDVKRDATHPRTAHGIVVSEVTATSSAPFSRSAATRPICGEQGSPFLPFDPAEVPPQ